MEDHFYGSDSCRMGASTPGNLSSTRSTRRPSSWFHHKHFWPVRQAGMSLSSARRTGAWPQPQAHVQSGRQVCLRVFAVSSCNAQGRARGSGVSQVSAAHSRVCRSQCRSLPSAPDRRGAAVGSGKKTAEAIRQEVAREVDQLLCAVFNGRRKTGRLDLEAVETAVRAAMRHAGSAALTALLQLAAPTTEEERATVASWPATVNTFQVRADSRGPGRSLWSLLCARTVIKASFRPKWNWTLRTPSSRPACAACTLWWEGTPPSITAAKR